MKIAATGYEKAVLLRKRKEQRALPFRRARVKNFNSIHASPHCIQHSRMLVRADLAWMRKHRNAARRMRDRNRTRNADVFTAYKGWPPFEQEFIKRIRTGKRIPFLDKRIRHMQPRNKPLSFYSILDGTADLP